MCLLCWIDIGHHQSSALRVEMRFLSKLPSHHHPTFNYLVGSVCSSYDEVQHNSLKLSHTVELYSLKLGHYKTLKHINLCSPIKPYKLSGTICVSISSVS